MGGVLAEPGGLSDALGEVFRELADVAPGFFGAAEDSFDVHLRSEAGDVRGLDEFLTRLIEGA